MSKSKEPAISPKIKKLLTAKTPEEYVDLTFKSGLTQKEKIMATRLWLENRDYTRADITHARNRHPHWKSEKLKDHLERTKKRFEEYNYSTSKIRSWTKELLTDFVEKNDSLTDKELAKTFKRSIPGIQAIRRRINIAKRIIEAEGKSRPTKAGILKLITSDEKVLRRTLEEIKPSR